MKCTESEILLKFGWVLPAHGLEVVGAVQGWMR